MNNYIRTTDDVRKSLFDQMLAFYNLPVESIEKDLWLTNWRICCVLDLRKWD